MIYFVLEFSTITAVIKRYRRLLLMLPVFMILAGCDSTSSPIDSKSNTTQGTSVSSERYTDRQDAAKDLQYNDEQDLDNEMDDGAEGQSLIAAARSDNNKDTQQSPMISRKRDDSTLQATLMGDYGGMLPCSSCDSIDSTLNLFADGSVRKTSIYNNPETPKAPLVESGIYRQDNNTITIVYENKNIEAYRIQDSHLVMIDENENLDADYTLARK